MRMSQSLRDCRQNSVLLWDEFGWINSLLFPLKSGDWELIDSPGFRIMVGPSFGGNPLL